MSAGSSSSRYMLPLFSQMFCFSKNSSGSFPCKSSLAHQIRYVYCMQNQALRCNFCTCLSAQQAAHRLLLTQEGLNTVAEIHEHRRPFLCSFPVDFKVHDDKVMRYQTTTNKATDYAHSPLVHKAGIVMLDVICLTSCKGSRDLLCYTHRGAYNSMCVPDRKICRSDTSGRALYNKSFTIQEKPDLVPQKYSLSPESVYNGDFLLDLPIFFVL